MESWLFKLKFPLRIDVGAFCEDVPGLGLSSVESLESSVLYFLGLLAAFGPFQHLSALWLVTWLVICFHFVVPALCECIFGILQ